MYPVGGVSCDEEFGLFLAANPDYVPYGDEPNDPAKQNGAFFCSDGGERRYYIPFVIPDCNVAIANFFLDNPQFEEVTAIDTGFYLQRYTQFVCPGSGIIRWYGYTPIGNYNRMIAYLQLAGDADALTLEGIAFLESERIPGENTDDLYRRLSNAEFFVSRFFDARGGYRVFVERGSRYHLLFPEYIIPTPPP